MDDKNFLFYVERLPSVRAIFEGQIDMPDLSMMKVLRRPRQSDAHHAPSLLNERRRTCDWFTVPLWRVDHDWIHTAEGMRWERTNLTRLYSFSLRMLYSVSRIEWEDYADEDDPELLLKVRRVRLQYSEMFSVKLPP
jgi:hypothetical protein